MNYLRTKDDFLKSKNLKLYFLSLSFNSQKALLNDWKSFNQFCLDNNLDYNLLEFDIICFYLKYLNKKNFKPASISRHLHSVLNIYKNLNFKIDSNFTEKLYQYKKILLKNKDKTQRQAQGLTEFHIKPIYDKLKHSTEIKDLRDLSLILLAKDILSRRSELVNLNWDDITFKEDGSGLCYIRKSKTDQTGLGVYLYISSRTCNILKLYKEQLLTQIQNPIYLFYSLKNKTVGTKLHDSYVSSIFKQLAQLIGMKDVSNISGHSTRVGMTQDLVSSGASLIEIMNVGRWKSPQMPARYSEHLQASQSAVAKFYKEILI